MYPFVDDFVLEETSLEEYEEACFCCEDGNCAGGFRGLVSSSSSLLTGVATGFFGSDFFVITTGSSMTSSERAADVSVIRISASVVAILFTSDWDLVTVITV